VGESHRSYLKNFAYDVTKAMGNSLLAKYEKYQTEETSDEIEIHLRELKTKASAVGCDRSDIIDPIKHFLDSHSQILLVEGVSGFGKTTCLAKALVQTQDVRRLACPLLPDWLLNPKSNSYYNTATKQTTPHPPIDELSHVYVTRFLGNTSKSSDARSLLKSISHQILRAFSPPNPPEIPEDFERLKHAFRTEIIPLASAHKQLVISLDSIDQLAQTFNALNDFSWLPLDGELPPHVKIILTTIPVLASTHQRIYEGLKNQVRTGSNR